MATILIVEDRPIERKFLATLLKTAGYETVESGDGAEALVLAQRVRPDLVISDILMPSVDGYELVRRMRDMPTLVAIPVIFYTATYNAREAWMLARQCGVAKVLTKPSSPATILETIDDVLSSGSASVREAVADDAFALQHLEVVQSALTAKVADLEASEQRLTAIIGVAHQIAAERSPVAMLARVCRAAREVTLAQHGAIAMLTKDGSAFPWVVTQGTDDVALRLWTPRVRDAVIHPVIHERRAVRMRNPGGDPAALGFPADHPPLYSCLIVPIAAPQQVFGCLVLRNKLGEDHFSSRDEDVAVALATQAGIAYENSRLFEDVQRHAEALEREVGERQRVAAELRQSHERQNFALAAARMGTWEIEFATDRVKWSETMAAVFGLTPDQAPTTAEQFSALIHPEDRAVLTAAMNRAVREGGDFQPEFRVTWPDGSVHTVYGHAQVVFGGDGTPLGLLGVGIDISDRKSLEAQLRQSQKMEAIGQLAGGVAHDFNNLLTAIRGYSDLLADTFEADDPRRADVEEIISASRRAAALTRQLLTFSRKQVIEPILLDVNQIVTETTKLLRRVIGEDIEVIVTLAREPAMVVADPSQIEQVVMNLVVNARDAMPRGGRLSIETALTELDESYATQHLTVKPGRYVLMTVTDNGTGMDEATRLRVFEPFFTTKGRALGTGLGLATVYGIVSQSSGYIWVYSELAHGTTFKVYLPDAAGTSAPEPAGLETEAAPAGTETILLVEDEEAVRNLSRVLLERAGYQVLDAPDADQAERIFRQHPGTIALLLTDVVIPGLSGPELFARLESIQPDLRVVFMSGYPDREITRHPDFSVDVAFVQKPFTGDGLVRKVREALDR